MPGYRRSAVLPIPGSPLASTGRPASSAASAAASSVRRSNSPRIEPGRRRIGRGSRDGIMYPLGPLQVLAERPRRKGRRIVEDISTNRYLSDGPARHGSNPVLIKAARSMIRRREGRRGGNLGQQKPGIRHLSHRNDATAQRNRQGPVPPQRRGGATRLSGFCRGDRTYRVKRRTPRGDASSSVPPDSDTVLSPLSSFM